MSETADPIAGNLTAVRDRIAKAAVRAGRRPEDVTLVAVSKTHPADAVAAAIACGQLVFGENRVQEGMAKFRDLREGQPALELHLIGPLQTNKAAEAVAHFDVIQSLDRARLAQALAREMERQGRQPRLFIQVNTGEEPQKAGVLPADADAFVAACRRDYGLEPVGLMCIPPADDLPAPHFAFLRTIAERNGLPLLSMGMSGDFESAVELGATHVRVGTAIFGARPPL